MDSAHQERSYLPLDLIEKILGRINPFESARLATVCKPWAAIVSRRLATLPPHLFAVEFKPPARRSKRATEPRRTAVVSVPLDGSCAAPTSFPALLPSAVSPGMICVAAMPSGRIAFVENNYLEGRFQLVLANPVTGAYGIANKSGELSDWWLSHGGRPSSSFVFLRRSERWGDDHLAVFRDDDKRLQMEWKLRLPGGAAAEIRDVAYCGGACYVLQQSGELLTADARAPRPLHLRKLRVPSPIGAPPDGEWRGYRLVESDGELLLLVEVESLRREMKPRVAACCDCDGVRGHAVSGFEVHRLDREKMRWEKLDRLPGGRALFVGISSSAFSVPASGAAGCMSDCVYFVTEGDCCFECDVGTGSTWGVYSMVEGKVLFERTVGAAGTYMEAEWLLPKPSALLKI